MVARKRLFFANAAAIGGAVLQLLGAILALAPAGSAVDSRRAPYVSCPGREATIRSRLPSGPWRGISSRPPCRPSGSACAAPVLRYSWNRSASITEPGRCQAARSRMAETVVMLTR